MIALISQAFGEATTVQVMDWLHHLRAPHLRINGDELNEGVPFAAELRGDAVSLEVELGEGEVLRGEDVGAVWLRRWHVYQNLARWKELAPAALGYGIHGYLAREMHALSGVVEEAMDGAGWLTRGDQMSVRKFSALRHAARAGLEVPPTLVTNSRARLEAFRRAHGRVVCKPIRDGDAFAAGGKQYCAFTAEVTDDVVVSLPATFFPTLLQPRVEKAYEIRVFYLAGRCWPMAIFSQNDPQTSADFRHYNQRRPNRTVPFRLPAVVEERCRTLMAALGLTTGSLDFIRTPGGGYVFLEVNPVGQLGMVSAPCNYQLERHVAEYLIALEAR